MHLRPRNQIQPFRMVAVVLLCLSSQANLIAEESLDQARQLRERGQYDAALKTLRKLSGDMSLDEEVRVVADYETGVTLVEKSRSLGDSMSRRGALDEAESVLKQFGSRHGEHPLACSARSQLGNVLVEKAKIEVERSKDSTVPANRERDLAAARGYYVQAQSVFSENLAETKKALERIGVSLDREADRKKMEIRDQLRAEYLQLRLLIPAVEEQQAEAFGEASDERHELLRSAAQGFGSVHKDYRTRLAGLYGLLYQGRCYVKLDECEKALECFEDLLEQPDGIILLKQLKLKSALLAADCWLDERQQAYERAIAVMQKMVDSSNEHELRQPDWLWLRVKLARAYKLRADNLAKDRNHSAENEKIRKQSAAKALEQARAAAEIPGDHANQARALVAEIAAMSEPQDPVQGNSCDEANEEDIKTFDDAYRAGRDTLKKMQDALVRRDKALLEKSQREAIRYFKMALDSVDVDTPTEDVNVARYLLAYVYYSSDDFEKAAETGEFLARRFPTHRAARPAGKIALAAYLNQYERAVGKRKQLLAVRLASICRHSIKTWPDEAITVDAAQTLTMLALRNNELDEASSNLELVPEKASKRGSLEIQLGQSLWRASLDETDEQKIVALRKKARQFLEKGIRRPATDGGLSDVASPRIAKELKPIELPKVSQHVATGALSLCQIYVHEKAYAKAVALLEDKTIGPFTLVMGKHPAASLPGFDVLTFTVATRAYRGIVESDKSDAETQKEAERKLKQTIVELERARAASDGGRIELDLTPPEPDLLRRSD